MKDKDLSLAKSIVIHNSRIDIFHIACHHIILSAYIVLLYTLRFR